MTPRATVVLKTFRPGGFDIAFGCLSRQTFTDFEVLVVDEHHVARADVLARYASDYGLAERVRFIAPERSLWPVESAAMAFNTGVKYARGSLVVLFSDYAWAPSGWLAEHWASFEEHGASSVCLGPFLYVLPPRERTQTALQSDLPLQPTDTRAPFTLFDLPLQESEVLGMPTQGRNVCFTNLQGQDGKLFFADGFCNNGAHYLFEKNESVSRELLCEVNGSDEAFAGSHCYGDTDLGERLALAGARFYVRHRALVRIVQVRDFIRSSQLLRPIAENERLLETRRQQRARTGGYRAPNVSDLRTAK